MGRSFYTKGGAFQFVKSSAIPLPNLLQPRSITLQNIRDCFIIFHQFAFSVNISSISELVVTKHVDIPNTATILLSSILLSFFTCCSTILQNLRWSKKIIDRSLLFIFKWHVEMSFYQKSRTTLHSTVHCNYLFISRCVNFAIVSEESSSS